MSVMAAGSSLTKNGDCVNTRYTLLKTLLLKSGKRKRAIDNPSVETSSHL